MVTGHEDPDKGGELDWDAVARVGGTIVILMGVGRLPKIVDRLLAGGLAPDTPAAAVRWGTRPEQHTVRATLATIADQDLQAPSVIVIGEVAATDLDWFESPPAVRHARRRHPARPPGRRRWRPRCAAAGAEPVVVPTIEITEPDDDGAALRAAVADLDDVAWVVLTSANGAGRFCDALRDGRDLAGREARRHRPRHRRRARPPRPGGRPGARAVRRRVAARGVPAPARRRPVAGSLLARAAVARDVLPDGLRAMGWDVEVVPVYRTVPAVPTDEQRDDVRGADVVTFTSASTVEQWMAAFGAELIPPVVACIGPVTADTARRHGLRVDVVADVHTIPGLVDAITAHVAGPPPKAPARRGGRRRGRA